MDIPLYPLDFRGCSAGGFYLRCGVGFCTNLGFCHITSLALGDILRLEAGLWGRHEESDCGF